jgi:hypothetical protein
MFLVRQSGSDLEFHDFAYELSCATWADGRERERLDRGSYEDVA